MRIDLTPVSPRTCGSCTLCCKVLEIPELAKPRGQWCPAARKGTGCSRYDNRPEVCHDFECLWLQGLTPEECRPDKVHAVLTTTKDNANLVVQEDPGYPGIGRRRLRPLIEAFIADGTHYAIIACGEDRTFMGDPALLGSTLATGTIELGKGDRGEGV